MRWKGPAPYLEILTDAQWTELRHLSDLPDEARKEVNGLISFYRKYRTFETATDLSDRLVEIAKTASKLAVEIEELRETEQLFTAYCGPQSDERKKNSADKKLLSLMDALNDFHKVILKSPKKTTPRPGPKPADVLKFVLEGLNVLLIEGTGCPLSRAKTRKGYGVEEFAIKTLQIADPFLKRSTISNKIKALVSEMDYWDEDFIERLRINQKARAQGKKTAGIRYGSAGYLSDEE